MESGLIIRNKVWCIFPMVIGSEVRMEQYWDDDHRENAPQFIRSRNQFSWLRPIVPHEFNLRGINVIKTSSKWRPISVNFCFSLSQLAYVSPTRRKIFIMSPTINNVLNVRRWNVFRIRTDSVTEWPNELQYFMQLTSLLSHLSQEIHQ